MRSARFLTGLVALLAFDTLGQIAFKLTADAVAPVVLERDFLARVVVQPWALAVIVAYLGAFLAYTNLMRDAPIGPLFAASHLDIVTVAAISVFCFGERLSLTQVSGCATIIAGVMLLGATERSQPQPSEASRQANGMTGAR